MSDLPSVHRFGPFELDTAACRLKRDGTPIDVSPRLIDLLAQLVARPGDLLTKEELIATLWPGVFVTDNSLTRAVSELRHVLGDETEHPQYIQTVSRRGYRFVGAVQSTPRTAAAIMPEGLDRDPLAAYTAFAEGRLQLESLSADALPSAVEAFERLRTEKPNDARVRVGLSSAYLLQFEATRATTTPNQDRLERGVTEAREACRLDPTLGDAWATLGYLLTARGDSDEARASAGRAVALEPDNWRHHFRYAFASWGEDRLRSVARTLALHPSQPYAYFLSAMVFIARGALPAAHRALTDGVRSQDAQQGRQAVFPAVGLHWLQGLVLAALGRRDDALAECERELAFEGTHTVYATEFVANACVLRGCLLLSANPAGAVTAFREALERLPGQARAHLGLGIALEALGRRDESSGEHEAASAAVDRLTATGRHSEPAIVHASMLVARQRPDEAAAVLEHLLTTKPPGPAGWSIPVEPLLITALPLPAFGRVRAMLAERAA